MLAGISALGGIASTVQCDQGPSFEEKAELPVFAEKFVLPLSSGAVLILMFANPMHWGWTNRIVGILLALALAGLAVLLIQRANTKQKSAATLANPTTPRPVIRKAGRMYIPEEVTLHSLQARVRDKKLTELQNLASVQPYLGKWVRYTGQIDDVIGNAVVFELSSARVMAYFGKEWYEHLPILPRGKTVTIDGRVEEIGFLGVRLSECEFVDGSAQ